MIKIRINLIITAVWIAMLALLLIQIYQTIQLYDRKSDDIKSRLDLASSKIAIIHERAEDINHYAKLINKDLRIQYQDILKEEFQNLFEVKESIEIRDTAFYHNGKLEKYLVVVGETYDSITGTSTQQRVLARDIRQIHELVNQNKSSLIQQDSIRAAYHLDQRVMHKIVKKAKYVNDMLVATFRDNVYQSPESRINLKLLDSIISIELRDKKLPSDFEFAISEENNELIHFMKKSDHFNRSIDTSKTTRITLFPNKILEDQLTLHLYFPKQRTFVIKAMGSPLLISLLLVILIIFTIQFMFRTILTQKRLSEMKNDFISNMTHEFKTPISTISLACEALNDKSMSGEKNELTQPFVKMIGDENKRLEILVEAILQSAVLDRGELKLKNEEVPLIEVIRNVAKNASFRIAGNNGKLNLNVPNQEVIVLGDRMHITNMISNLVDNAIKYSKENIQIEISFIEHSDKYQLTVSDKGIGIKKEYLAKIFDKLYRVPMGNIHNVKGFGLGLSYVKAINQLLGWNLIVKSQFGEGSEFNIIIKK